MDGSEQRYLEGVALWRERDLRGAAEVLSSVVADGSPDSGDGWWHSASRALAQIALEADDPEADRHLRELQGSGVGEAQTLALRARHRFQVGEEEEALAEIHAAAVRLAADYSTDVGSLMNGAIALIWSAEILAELGYADDAYALAARARDRISAAEVHDRVLAAMLGMIEASVARLSGNVSAAVSALEGLDTALSPDFPIQVLREHARIAVTHGQPESATKLYERCLGLARDSNYGFLEKSIADEMIKGPPPLRTDRAPVGQWDPRAMENVPDDHLPYALVIRLPLREEGTVLEFQDRVAARLDVDPRLGYVDGTGTDGEIWEIFLEGEDAEALWEAVRPLLESASLWRHAEVTIREGSGSRRFRLSRPD